MNAWEEAAALIVGAHRVGRPINRLPASCRPDSIEAAYAVQDAVAAALGPIGGWKVGVDGPQATPRCAPVLARDIVPSGTRFAAAGFHGLALEIEFGFRLERDLPAHRAPYRRDEVAAAVAFVAVVEVIASRFLGWTDLPEAERLADRNANGALVLGEPAADWAGLDFRRERVELRIDGRLVQSAAGTHPVGDPLRLVAWQADHAIARGRPLCRGDIVTTGSLQGMTPLGAGSIAAAGWGAWGRVELGFR